jgi:uncharacterized protein YeaO (DUF488 family)
MAVSVVRLGTPRSREEGLRIGTVRRPPRGVPKSEFASRDFFDVWLPELAPSEALLKRTRGMDSDADWTRFAIRYRAEMSAPDRRRFLDVLAALSHHGRFSVGCYCADASRCHRSLLAALLAERGADLAHDPARAATGEPEGQRVAPSSTSRSRKAR